MKKRDLNRSTTVRDLDELAGQIVVAIGKLLEDYPKKDDLDKKLEKFVTKEDLNATETRLEGKIEDVASDVSDIRRRVIDLETEPILRVVKN